MKRHRLPCESVPVRRCFRFAAASILVFGVAGAPPATGAEHPQLVDPDSTECLTCHDDLTAGRSIVHAPALDGCDTCHEFTTADDASQVALTESEPALCQMCHDGFEAAVAGELGTPHYPVTESCLGCHDPHASQLDRLLVASQSELCAACHDAEDLAEPHGGQLTDATTCSACHAPHGSDHDGMLTSAELHAPFGGGSCDGCHREPFGDRIRLRARGSKLCSACHGDVTEDAGTDGSVHAALRDHQGRAGCLDCHDPHMSANRKLLSASGPDLCTSCHEEILEGATSADPISSHPPAVEDCLGCHLPHASEQARLLAAPAGELCLMCHDAEDANLVRTHLGANLGSIDCSTCHQPHSSPWNALLNRTVHEPLLDGCDVCHEGNFDQLAEDGESSLCLMCHDDIGDAAEQAAVPHAALELARCADCHNPHASGQDHLVASAGDAVCVACHDDQAPATGEFAHGAIELLGCQGCHEPHGGEQPGMLRRSGNELCLSCHDPSRVESAPLVLDRFEVPAGKIRAMASLRLSADGLHNHPVVKHRVLGTPTEAELKASRSTFDGELTCLTCHDPHKGRSQELLNWNAASTLEACVHCHPN